MVVGVAVCELHLPQARSLKDKRRVVRSLVERAHQRYRVSVAETAFHDLHQRCEISIAAVGQGESEVSELMDRLRQLFDQEMQAMVSHWSLQYLEAGGGGEESWEAEG